MKFKGLPPDKSRRAGRFNCDSDHAISERMDGEHAIDPCYIDWTGMLTRCYSEGYHKRRPTYKGCSVVSEWHSFSVFEGWWESNVVDGYALDKDILGDGKVYSPDNCVFVPRWLNNFLCLADAIRGEYPVGVCKPTGRKGYTSYAHRDGKRFHIGVFSTPEEAHSAWRDFKLKTVHDKKDILDKIDSRLYPNLVSKLTS